MKDGDEEERWLIGTHTKSYKERGLREKREKDQNRVSLSLRSFLCEKRQRQHKTINKLMADLIRKQMTATAIN